MNIKSHPLRAAYLCGSNYWCAQGQGSRRFGPPEHPFAPPAARTAHGLGQPRALPYFVAFPAELATLAQLCRWAEAEIRRAAADAGWSEAELAGLPIFLGSTSYVMSDREAARPVCTEAERFTLCEIAGYLKTRFASENVFSFATSCTSSAQALLAAARSIENGLAERAVVLGIESFNRLTFEHFHAMNLLETEPGRLPFCDAGGLVLGEAAAALALSARPHPSYACRLRGLTAQTDHANLTASSAEPLHRLLAECLRRAGTAARDLRGVKAHGSGGLSDAVEMQVRETLWPHTPALLFKPYAGHTLGAGAALETALLLAALQQGRLPPLPAASTGFPLPTLHGRPLPNGSYLNYFLGFGGSHCAWLLDWQA
ncbi:beta-ketoacyl synthase N-terminal-like domain-containing protein [Eikenella sp. Marseille-P7795]|uniref:beta-ketoacyl synthase N-terminal-like domain-containing protein n=1 Tax=Eikenella sp. Marseille-P7795 TaxID=2866577 RepID=UPI001CE3D036|nr:beta-ketoacyl synthase N-terminal-like domain-containing protein [Eikenella sp. Marseille-P7795]